MYLWFDYIAIDPKLIQIRHNKKISKYINQRKIQKYKINLGSIAI